MAESEPVGVRRPQQRPNPFRIVRTARRNLLEAWPEQAYSAETFRFRLLRQRYFVCNSADAVRHVFSEAHDNYDRKSPQMRRALEPLLGDGLFVSDGETWRQRRAQCTPAFEPELLPGFAAVMTDAVGALADQWQGRGSGEPVDMLEEMAQLTARIIGRTVFGDDTSDDGAPQVGGGFSDTSATSTR